MRSDGATVTTTNAIGRHWIDLYVASSVFLLLIAYSPALYGPFWSIREALVVLLAGVGLPRLWPLLRSPGHAPLGRPAAAAASFLGIATIATLLSGQIWMSVLGLYNWGTGLLFVAGLVGAWAVAASAGPASRRLVERAFLAGALVNAAVGVLEGGADLGRLSLPEYQGRAHGVLGNPVHLGAIAAAAAAILVSRLQSAVAPDPGARSWRLLAGIGLTAAAVEVSGARSGLIALGAVLVWAWLRRGGTGGAEREGTQGAIQRTIRRAIRRGAVAATLAVVVGVGAGVAVSHAGGHGATGSASRLAGESGGFSSRIGHWRAALPAIGHRPLLGAGPGRFGAATTSHVSLAATRAENGNRFVDAHNLIVEYATTTGLLGLCALLAWLALAVRRSRGPLLAAALVILAVGLVEPQSVSTTPVAFLLLGASAAPESIGPGTTRRRVRPPEAVIASVCAALAVVFALRIVVGDWWLHETHLDLTVHEGRAALRVLPPWPVPANLLALAYAYQWQVRADPALEVTARQWEQVAIDRDPSDPELWMQLAQWELRDGLPEAALKHYGEALRLNPWSTQALNGLGSTERSLGHLATARSWFQESLRVEPHQAEISSELAQLR